MTNQADFNAVILDEDSFNPGDLDLSGLITLVNNWKRYPATKSEQRAERLADAHIVIANKVVFDQPLLEKLPQLRVILLTATGMDNVDLSYCQQHNIAVYNVTDYCTASVSQHVFTMVLALSTQLIPYQQVTKGGEWSRGEQFSSLKYPIHELNGKTLGLIGYGSLAKGVEKVAKAFGMKILIAKRSGTLPTAIDSDSSIKRLPLNELLPKVDVLSLHCPLTPETRHLIGRDALEQMKPSALLINTARGGVVNNAELAAALREGTIAGAGIDVLEQEPPPHDHPLLADDIPNLILTPHIAWAAVEARQRVIDKVASHLKNWLQET